MNISQSTFKERVQGKTKQVDHVVHSIKPFPPAEAKELSNANNDILSPVDFFKLVHQCLFLKTNILFQIKLVIHLIS